MDLERTTLPTRGVIQKAPVGTVYFYRRLLFVWPEPFGIAYVKVAPNAWQRSEGRGVEAEELLAGVQARTNSQSHSDAAVAKKLVASEVDADEGEPHHGLFRGEIVIARRLAKARAKEEAAITKREAEIAAHDPKRCDSATHVGRLTALLEEIDVLAAERNPEYETRRGATKQQLASLRRAAGVALPKDLVALYSWSNGNPFVSLLTTDDVIGQQDFQELRGDELPIIEIGDGDFYVYIAKGRERGILRTYFNDDAERGPGFASLVEWAEHVKAKLAPPTKKRAKRR